MNEQRLLIYGAGGHGHVVADAARGQWSIEGFLDDDESFVNGVPDHLVISARRVRENPDAWRGYGFALGVGDNARREQCYRLLKELRLPLVTVVHPSAVVSPSAQLGEGTVVLPRSVVNAGARVGLGVIINSAAIVEHDCRVDSFSHVSPGAVMGGGASVGERAHLGLNSCILPQVHVGADARVGAGAVVTVPVPASVTVVGVPARQIVYRTKRER